MISLKKKNNFMYKNLFSCTVRLESAVLSNRKVFDWR